MTPVAAAFETDPGRPPRLTEHEVHVWAARLDRTDAVTDWLDFTERQRAARFRFPHDRQRWANARSALRGVLSRYVGVAPEHLHFATAAHGKPFLVSNGRPSAVQFNLTHSGDLALIAVACAAVGIDTEDTRRAIDWTAVACEAFTVRERTACPGGPGLTCFELWTLKEAYLKGRGCGLAMPLQAFEVLPGAAEDAFQVEVAPDWDDGRDWSLYRIPAGASHAAAVACASPIERIRLIDWSAAA